MVGNGIDVVEGGSGDGDGGVDDGDVLWFERV